ncbi:inorganic phosphate transporter [Candidatus Bathyarchaeota archaeon]|nr:MAG: inorganic phosphate transporter [Candidatus Bathyarchaeota archaeon]TMI31281.1 MAG: inorganic phosphate transporter [Candidatus Bathyarchaeota archaeon]
MTDLFSAASLLLAGLLGIVVGGNNLSACSGTIIGTGMVSKRSGILIATAGYILGLSLEGPKLFQVRERFLPTETSAQVFSILFATLLVFVGGEFARVPLSLSKALTGAILGVSLSAGTLQVNRYLGLIFLFWTTAPIVATGLGVVLVGLDDRYSPQNLWLKLSILKAGLLFLGFFSAYVLGNNTLGLIVGVPSSQTFETAVVVGLGAVLGAFTLGQGVLRRLTEGIFQLRYPNAFFAQLLGTSSVELASQLGIPVSITETVSSGIIGSGFARKMRVMNVRNVFLILTSWVVSPASGAIAGFLLSRLFG